MEHQLKILVEYINKWVGHSLSSDAKVSVSHEVSLACRDGVYVELQHLEMVYQFEAPISCGAKILPRIQPQSFNVCKREIKHVLIKYAFHPTPTPLHK